MFLFLFKGIVYKIIKNSSPKKNPNICYDSANFSNLAIFSTANGLNEKAETWQKASA